MSTLREASKLIRCLPHALWHRTESLLTRQLRYVKARMIWNYMNFDGGGSRIASLDVDGETWLAAGLHRHGLRPPVGCHVSSGPARSTPWRAVRGWNARGAENLCGTVPSHRMPVFARWGRDMVDAALHDHFPNEERVHATLMSPRCEQLEGLHRIVLHDRESRGRRQRQPQPGVTVAVTMASASEDPGNHPCRRLRGCGLPPQTGRARGYPPPARSRVRPVNPSGSENSGLAFGSTIPRAGMFLRPPGL
jgi:hypothetical protein